MTLKNPTSEDLLALLVAYLQDELADAPPIGAILKFDYSDGGCVLIDGADGSNGVSANDGPADCVVTLSLAAHLQMMRFELDQASAFREGRMRIKGNIAVALRLAPLISKPFRLPGETR
jgi:putative sterol carrier protein